MTIPVLHVPQKDSPQSSLAAGINDTVTTLELDDSSIFEADSVTRLTLGIDQSVTEVVTISSYDGNNEITVVRGSPAYNWPLGTLVARVLNSEDIEEIHEYLDHLNALTSSGAMVTGGDTHDHDGGDGAPIPEGGILNGAVTESKIGSGAVTEGKLGTGSVVTSKLGADAVDGTKIADNAVNSEHIYAGAIDTAHIGDLQVTANKLASNAVTEGKIGALAVTAGKIGTGAITEEKLLFPYLFNAAGGRLTLESGVPISTTDQTAKTTLYYTPHIGNLILVYISGTWRFRSFAELSLSLSGYTAGMNYDIWIYDNAGTLTLDSTVWTSNSVRATALAYQDGILVKSGDATRRYLGTIRITATTGECNDGELDRLVWNMYNQVRRQGGARLAGSINTDQTALGKTEYVIGLAQAIRAGIGGKCTATTGTYCALYLLYDTASVGSADANAGIWSRTALSAHFATSYSKLRAPGYHYVSMGLGVESTAGVLSEGYLWIDLDM